MLRVEDFPEPNCEVWEENWDVLQLFADYSNQWRMGAGGPIGLDYNVFHHALDRKKLSPSEYEEWFDNLRIIENAALQQLQSK